MREHFTTNRLVPSAIGIPCKDVEIAFDRASAIHKTTLVEPILVLEDDRLAVVVDGELRDLRAVEEEWFGGWIWHRDGWVDF